MDLTTGIYFGALDKSLKEIVRELKTLNEKLSVLGVHLSNLEFLPEIEKDLQWFIDNHNLNK